MDWLNAIAGLFVGIVVGLTGVGGGSLMSPILILFFGIAPATAIGTDLLFAAITKSVGGYVHHSNRSVDWGIVGLLAIGSVPATLIAGLVLWHAHVEHLKQPWLSQALGGVLIASAIATLVRSRVRRWMARLAIRRHPQLPKLKAMATILAGAILGALVTITSVGAGALGATILLFLYPYRLTLRKLVGTDVAHAVPVALLGGLVHLLIGTVNLGLLAMLLIGSVPGIIIGARLSAVIPERIVQPVLALLVAISGYKLLS